MIANTKGFTGHAMATGIEDVVAVKALETGCVPPVANFKEVDPELGQLNLSKGGTYPVDYAIHLGAGFGSQISMMLLRWVKTKDGIRRSPNDLGYAYRIADATAWSAWLSSVAGSSGRRSGSSPPHAARARSWIGSAGRGKRSMSCDQCRYPHMRRKLRHRSVPSLK